MQISTRALKSQHPRQGARRRTEIGRSGCRSMPLAKKAGLGRPVHRLFTPATERLLYDILNIP